jgi:hypothetical protein
MNKTVLNYENISMHVEFKNESCTGINRGKWNCLKIIRRIPEQRTWQARHLGTAEISHFGHCAHTS